ncbi:MAG: hemolysin III family protein [Roseitalea sp.]|jgi:hemolysin III|nr:hemolysin III family protein [Roseitalea sp.]MBO6832667.1 hemolysin III family protein [Roseitalea sp.]
MDVSAVASDTEFVATRGADYPDYAREERIADGTIHVLGVLASLIGFAFVYAFAFTTLSVPLNSALIVYGLTVFGLFCFSAAYHMTPWPETRPLLRRFDQAAIFLKIAGSYTPVVVLIGGGLAYSLLAMIWAAALLGAAGKLFSGGILDRYTVLLYLAMGWASLLLVWPMFATVPFVDAWLIVAGGLIYSVGVIFHQWDGLKYQNAVWHGFVLSASACHFIAIVHASFALGA